VRDYLVKVPKRLAADRANAASGEFARNATRAEVMDATVCSIFYHTLYLGEVYRLAGMVGATEVSENVHARLSVLAAEVARESALRVLPLRPLVAVQAGAGLLAMAGDQEGA